MKFKKLLLYNWSSLFPGQILKNKLAKFSLMSAEGKASFVYCVISTQPTTEALKGVGPLKKPFLSPPEGTTARLDVFQH